MPKIIIKEISEDIIERKEIIKKVHLSQVMKAKLKENYRKNETQWKKEFKQVNVVDKYFTNYLELKTKKKTRHELPNK